MEKHVVNNWSSSGTKKINGFKEGENALDVLEECLSIGSVVVYIYTHL